ncbi:protein of unknown function [Variovorax sp. OK605]|jgi:hypothetical protein|uniref:DUF3883 domain-containing protein n=1 Tax=unclassified Variovorax TaxID=663243 RepID=UPI0008D4EC49|nr:MULTISPECIES: DUF3883 domain-containing protein [unclassified Variovorax]SEJ47686.1 protein of unknown function [Variovorax sp. OK202]SFC48542.1 protein of unknown function [Variovorax sp. OK212]SFP29453.1 protein of unknown function [Variovorax sp. OK605]
MENEVDPQVLAVINEKRLSGPRLTPVEIVAKMGVFDARDKPFDHAWLATGDNVIATIWAEWVNLGAGGRWFYLESLDTHHRAGGGERSAHQIQRAKDRLALLKRTFDAGQNFRAVVQTNRIAILEVESNKDAKVSTRVRDDDEWHVASWEPEDKLAVLVRGPRGWVPTDAEVHAAKSRGNVPQPLAATPAAAAAGGGAKASPEQVQAAAFEYVVKHFTGYGYKAENLSEKNLGYDLEVSNAKGQTLLRVVVKGTAPGVPSFKLSKEQSASSTSEPLWRLLVVMDAGGPTAQHKIYKPTEITSATGYEAF